MVISTIQIVESYKNTDFLKAVSTYAIESYTTYRSSHKQKIKYKTTQTTVQLVNTQLPQDP